MLTMKKTLLEHNGGCARSRSHNKLQNIECTKLSRRGEMYQHEESIESKGQIFHKVSQLKCLGVIFTRDN